MWWEERALLCILAAEGEEKKEESGVGRLLERRVKAIEACVPFASCM
jgi:hypothetical protein